MFPRTIAVLCLAAAGAVSCTTTIDSHTSLSPTAKFGEYQSFVIAGQTVPYTFEWSARSKWAHDVIQDQVERVLAAKGYAEAPGAGDLVVRIEGGQRARDLHPGASHPWLKEDESADFVEGAYVIDIYEGRSNELVWHGSGRTDTEPVRLDEDQLRRSVTTLLSTLPSRTGPGRR